MELEELKKLIEMLKDTDITDIQIEKEGAKIRLKREKFITSIEMPSLTQAAPAARQIAEQPAAEHREDAQRLFTVTAPLVGTFYRAPSPDAQPFAEEGDRVSKGQVLCIIEAMKLMNEIESDIDGVVVKILVENANPVEYGEPLFLIEPSQ
jgi:acetyl-CoA carboxylase biotin carboxyl carrier protein